MTEQTQPKTFTLQPIGAVRRGSDGIRLEIFEPFRPALRQLGEFSHVIALWWIEGWDNPESRQRLQCEPPYAAGHVTGVFACRAEYRPNPIGLTVCELVGVDETRGLVEVKNIDALDGTPLLDLKAYFPVLDRVQEAYLPAWLTGWPEWMPSEGIGLWEEEAEETSQEALC